MSAARLSSAVIAGPMVFTRSRILTPTTESPACTTVIAMVIPTRNGTDIANKLTVAASASATLLTNAYREATAPDRADVTSAAIAKPRLVARLPPSPPHKSNMKDARIARPSKVLRCLANLVSTL